MSATRTHTRVTFANPNLRCDECGGAVPAHVQLRNVPCGHLGVTSTCPSWSPVRGCSCSGHPHRDRAEEIG